MVQREKTGLDRAGQGPTIIDGLGHDRPGTLAAPAKTI